MINTLLQSTFQLYTQCKCSRGCSSGLYGHNGFLPQASFTPGMLSLILQSISHSWLAVAQALTVPPALLLHHPPADTLYDITTCLRPLHLYNCHHCLYFSGWWLFLFLKMNTTIIGKKNCYDQRKQLIGCPTFVNFSKLPIGCCLSEGVSNPSLSLRS